MASPCRNLALVLAFAATAVIARADDTFHPPWTRFQPNTTTQEWTFPDQNLPHAPDNNSILWNPNGTAQQLDTHNQGSGFLWLPTFNGRTGIYQLNPSGPAGPSILVFGIPNTQTPQPRKDVWAQITWFVDAGTTSVDLTPFGGSVPPTTVENGTVLDAFGWRHSTFSYVLQPNPSFEYYQIRNNSAVPIYIDQVVIDSQCVPEPASMAILGLGVVGLVCARRKKK